MISPGFPKETKIYSVKILLSEKGKVHHTGLPEHGEFITQMLNTFQLKIEFFTKN